MKLYVIFVTGATAGVFASKLHNFFDLVADQDNKLETILKPSEAPIENVTIILLY